MARGGRVLVGKAAHEAAFGDDLAHDLKGPLAYIQGAVEYLSARLNGDGTAAEITRELRKNIERLRVGIETVSGLFSPTRAAPSRASVQESLTRAIEPFEDACALGRIRLDRRCRRTPYIVSLDHEGLVSHLRRLVSDAVASMPPGGTLSLSLVPQGHHFFLSVSHSAPQPARKSALNVLGLFLARRWAEQEGGSLTIDRRRRRTLARFRLPERE